MKNKLLNRNGLQDILKDKRMLMKIILSYAFTFAVIDLADTASMVIDGIIVSRGISATALAAISIADPTFKTVSLFCGVFAVGIQSACSACMVRSDRNKNNEIFTFGCTAAVIISAVLTVLGFTFTDDICKGLGADGSDAQLYSYLYRYLCGWFTGIPGLICFLVISPVVTLDGNKKCVTAATVIQSVLNITGDALSVTVFDADTLGIGLSTGLAFDAAALVLLSNFFRKRSLFRLRFRLPDKKDISALFTAGLPRVTKYACKMLSPLIVNRMILSAGGSTVLAAVSVKQNVAGFCLVIGSGIAESIYLTAGLLYNENDRDSLREVMKIAVRSNFMFNAVLSVILFAAAEPAALVFTDADSAVYGMAVTVIRCLAVSLVFNGMNAIMVSYLQAVRQFAVTHVYTAFYKLISLAVCTFVLWKIFGINGIFYAVPVSEICTLVIYTAAALIIGHGSGIPGAMLMLKKDFGYTQNNSLYINITEIEQVTEISEMIRTFCKKNGIDKRRTYFAALCMEETAANIVEHGFTKDSRPHSCNIRIIIENGDITLRIRDDCRYFNLKERFETTDKSDACSNIGIRLIHGIAKEINYINIIGTNTLIIRI